MMAKCPHCGHPNDVVPREKPHTIQCPGCGRALRVPARKTAPAGASPRSSAPVGTTPEHTEQSREQPRVEPTRPETDRSSVPVEQDGTPDNGPSGEEVMPPLVTEPVRRSTRSSRRSRRRSSDSSRILIVGSCAALLGIGLVAWLLYEQRKGAAKDVPNEAALAEQQSERRYRLLPVRNQRKAAGELLELKLRPAPTPQSEQAVHFELVHGPEGSEVDREQGIFRWSIPADAPGDSHVVKVAVCWGSDPQDRSTLRFIVTVVPGRETARTQPRASEPSPADQDWPALAKKLQAAGLTVARLSPPKEELKNLLGGQLRRVMVGGSEVWAIWFADEQALQEKLDGLEFGDVALPEDEFPDGWAGRLQLFQSDHWLVMHASLSPKTLEGVRAALGPPLPYQAKQGSGGTPLANLPGMKAEAARPGKPEADSDRESSNEENAETPAEEAWSEIRELFHEKDRLFQPRAYKTLRSYLASQFAREHQDAIQQAWGSEGDSFRAFLDEHPEIRDEFFVAVDVDHDRIDQALALLKQLYDEFPEAFEEYANLAIAVAVTWDQPRSMQSYRWLMKHVKATEGGPPVTAVESFRYYVEAEPVMQGRIRFLPWEMLVHVVNHETPLAERQWALQNYLARRVKIGKCYHDVPYDQGYYRVGSEVAKLNGKPYTLPSIRQFGGICANQADFASRVARSIGVPAAYVSGQGRFGEAHAWVMWVELQRVTAQGIQFSLESHGRYRTDMYYVGNLKNPQTGLPMTDRQLELYLHSVGISPLGRRQASMLMRVFPRIRREESLDFSQRLAYLRRTLDRSPYLDATWRELASMAGEEEARANKKNRLQMRAVMDTLFRTFAPFPDFTWEVFGDLVQIEEDQEKQNALYVQLVGLYERAKRPDLAFRARLAAAGRLEEQGHATAAANLLADGIQRFPDEGRFVPKVLDELERLCQTIENGDQVLIPFYASFLPRIPQKRGSDASKYCMQMYERAIGKFQAAGRADLANRYQLELTKLRAIEAEKKLRATN